MTWKENSIAVNLDFDHAQYKCIYHKYHRYIVYDFPSNQMGLKVVLFYYYQHNIFAHSNITLPL